MRINDLKVLDLFSGIGGFTLGLERAGGFKTVAFSEIEPYPSAVLATHWPAVRNLGDIRLIKSSQVGPVDVICGGFPCQNISQAGAAHGQQTGIEGEKSGLWSEYRRLIDELRPQWAVIENVSALRSQGLASLLQDLAEVGYDAQWDCIPASAVGSIQNRDRVWIIAYPSGQRVPRLLTYEHLSAARQRRTCGPEDLPRVYSDPFRSGSWPQPLLRRDHGWVPNWVDRIKALGNSVDPKIPQLYGEAIRRYRDAYST